MENNNPMFSVPTHSQERFCGTHNAVEQKSDVTNSVESQKNRFNDIQKCAICLEELTCSGEHRVCCLKCGHLFGHSCIERWLGNKKFCPECKAKSTKRDIRILFTNGIKTIDNGELEKVNVQLKQTALLLKESESKNKQLKAEENYYEHQMTFLRNSVTNLEKKNAALLAENKSLKLSSINSAFGGIKVFSISKKQSCRMMTYNPWYKWLLVSNSSSIHKVCCESLHEVSNQQVHSDSIRDLAFQASDPNVLLSVAFDRKGILTDIRECAAKCYIEEEIKLWSCSWSKCDTHTFFIGGQRGNIFKYDIRYLQSSVYHFQNQDDISPVVSLSSVSPSVLKNSLLSCQFNSCCAYSFKEEKYFRMKMKIQGPFTALKYNEKNDHVLISARANEQNNYMRQFVCSIEESNQAINLNTVHLFNGGTSQKLLTRPCHVNAASESMIAFYNETSRSMVFFSITTGNLMYSLSVDDIAIDSCFLESCTANISILTSSKLHLHNFSF